MKNLFLTSLALFVCSCTFMGCSDNEDTGSVETFIDNLVHDYPYRTVECTIDGEKVRLPEWSLYFTKEAFDEASGVAVYNLWFRGEYDYTIADRLPRFRISASQQGDDVIFSGEGLDNTSEYQLSVEGRFPQKQYTNNMLYLDIRRTASNETILTGNTFLLNLDANFVDLDEYEGEYIATTDHIRQYPLSFYFNCLHKVLGYKTLKLAFGEDSKVSIEGKDERSGQFVPF